MKEGPTNVIRRFLETRKVSFTFFEVTRQEKTYN